MEYAYNFLNLMSRYQSEKRVTFLTDLRFYAYIQEENVGRKTETEKDEKGKSETTDQLVVKF